MRDVFVTDGLVLPAASIRWSAVRAAGPGGQHVNRVATKVDLRFQPSACPDLRPRVRQRLLARARVDGDGCVVVVSQATRSRERNLEDAIGKLVALVRLATVEPIRRRATKPGRAAIERRLQTKRRRARLKDGRARVRTLD
ncbi:MAG: aminoacyl-tRNA hydrolase [Myxococcales bacterium FL481]|nr:MAG: aminoacyl-tRNA hydrolase [Myxococcales bacterium FL481]